MGMQAGLMALLAGMLQSGMQSLNGELQAHIGLFGASLTTHMIGGVLLAGYLLLRRERIRLGPMPWYLYSAGLWGGDVGSGKQLLRGPDRTGFDHLYEYCRSVVFLHSDGSLRVDGGQADCV